MSKYVYGFKNGYVVLTKNINSNPLKQKNQNKPVDIHFRIGTFIVFFVKCNPIGKFSFSNPSINIVWRM